MPYLRVPSKTEHFTFAMCARGDGKWMPTMFIFKKTLPNNPEYHGSGPENAAYAATESGHIDKSAYLAYIKHLNQYINNERPVVIFQDNLPAHKTPELVQFCVANDIHVINLPPKTSHILQPLDKLFGLVKTKIDQKKDEALLVNKGNIAKSKIPILVRFALASIKQSTF